MPRAFGTSIPNNTASRPANGSSKARSSKVPDKGMRNKVFSSTFGVGSSPVTLAMTNRPINRRIDAINAVKTARTVVKKFFMGQAIILLGTNLGDKVQNLATAKEAIVRFSTILGKSRLYESPPWGYQSTNSYLNQVLLVETDLGPEELLVKLLFTEKAMGRVREEAGYADRTIDLDMLDYDGKIWESELLVLPHPRLHLRRFTLMPMEDVVPNWSHPILQKSLATLLDECPDKVVPRPFD
ncbi:MAG TPA: 2-amino-4-hydroxy-6-hydroxymethyldihydropteridine diphosphokinase [Cryomorphaceae bacterium]|nr:2-amino-4-hydroxy-6-hydroxymethyldihydropteridine diphosphokinase [Cryomorphaceae bacterium]